MLCWEAPKGLGSGGVASQGRLPRTYGGEGKEGGEVREVGNKLTNFSSELSRGKHEGMDSG